MRGLGTELALLARLLTLLVVVYIGLWKEIMLNMDLKRLRQD
jgi:hypothetical protein